MTTTILLLKLAGLCHIGLLLAGGSLPRVTGFREHLAKLPPLLHRLFLVYYGFIGGLVAALGLISFFCADHLARGGLLASVLLLVMTLFWLARLLVALFVFDLRPYLTNPWRRVGYHALNAVFVYLLCLYAFALWKGVV